MSVTRPCPECQSPIKLRPIAKVASCAECGTLIGADGQRRGRGNPPERSSTLLSVGMRGKVPRAMLPGAQIDPEGAVGFTLIGCVQYRHQLGGLWTEWVVLLDEPGDPLILGGVAQEGGQRVWLSEHQGQFALLFERDAGMLKRFGYATDLIPDHRYQTPWGELQCIDRGTARVESVGGEVLEEVTLEADHEFADFFAKPNRFGSLSFGTLEGQRSGSGNRFFFGRMLAPSDLGLVAATTDDRMPESARCARCDVEIVRWLPRGAQFVCPKCNTGQAIVDSLPEVIFEQKSLRHTPKIPLGTRTRLDSAFFASARQVAAAHVVEAWPSTLTVVLVGHVVRSVVVDGETYFYEEYLLDAGPEGMSWLVHTDGKWYWARRCNTAAVHQHKDEVEYGGQTFRLKESNRAKIVQVLGESDYRIQPGEEATVADFAFEPRLISKEETLDEVVWTECLRIETGRVNRAFGVNLVDRSFDDEGGSETAGAASELSPVGILIIIAILVVFMVMIAMSDGCSGGSGGSFGFGK